MEPAEAEAAAEVIWDRALDLLLHDISGVRQGDRLLAAAIHVDGTFSRSGADAMPEFPVHDRIDGVSGLRWFGLAEEADIIDGYLDAARQGRRGGETELAANRAYNALDVASRLHEGLLQRLGDSPDAFAPPDLPRPPR